MMSILLSVFLAISLEAYHALLPTTPAPPASEKELQDLNIVRQRMPLAPPSSTALAAAEAKKYVTSLGIERDDKGQITGQPKIPTDDLGPDFMKKLSGYMQCLAWAKIAKGGDYIQAFNDLIDQINAQRLLYQLTGFRYNTYDEVRTIPPQLMNTLPACDTAQQVLLLDGFKYAMEFGRCYHPAYLINQNADIYYNGEEYIIRAVANQYDKNEAVRDLKAISDYMSRSTEPTPGGQDMLKPDGCGFHHNVYYINYMYAYNSFINQIYQLRGTCFRVSPQAVKRIVNAVRTELICCGASGFAAVSMSGRHPLAGGNKQTFSASSQLDSLCQDYQPIVENAIAPNGFYAFNYAPVGVYRQEGWTATMHAPTTRFWGAEIYTYSNGGNRFGRYQSHGALEIMYNGGMTASGWPSDGKGWDWNTIPGTTTVHYTDWYEMMPSRSKEQRFDQYTRTSDFSGALSLDSVGIWACRFDQADDYKGKQVFTPTNLRFLKSVFCAHGIMVAMGSNISAKGTYGEDMFTATNLFQSVEPTTTPSVDTIGNSIAILTPETTGYIIPNGNDHLEVIYGDQEGPELLASDIDHPTVKKAAKAWLNHGVKPTNHAYEFVAIPAVNREQLKTLTSHINEGGVYKVLAHDSLCHAVRWTQDSMIMATFFGPAEVTLNSLQSVSNEGLLTMTQKGTRIRLAAANPNLQPEDKTAYTISYWESSPSTLVLTFAGQWFKVNGTSEDVLVQTNQDQTIVTLTLRDGKTLRFSLDSDEQHAQQSDDTALPSLRSGKQDQSKVLLINGQIYIINHNQLYNLLGNPL